jgi:hypothetical protein
MATACRSIRRSTSSAPRSQCSRRSTDGHQRRIPPRRRGVHAQRALHHQTLQRDHRISRRQPLDADDRTRPPRERCRTLASSSTSPCSSTASKATLGALQSLASATRACTSAGSRCSSNAPRRRARRRGCRRPARRPAAAGDPGRCRPGTARPGAAPGCRRCARRSARAGLGERRCAIARRSAGWRPAAAWHPCRPASSRYRYSGPPAFGPVPDRPSPPNGCTPTTAPTMLRFT